MPKLEHVLQALIDTKIPITITGVWVNGVEFAFAEAEERHRPRYRPPRRTSCRAVVEWTNVRKPNMLADAIDAKARQLFPGTGYAERVEEQECGPQADINPLSDLDGRYAYKRRPYRDVGKAVRERNRLDHQQRCHLRRPLYFDRRHPWLWQYVNRGSDLAEKLQRMTLRKLRDSDYAKHVA